MSIEDAYVELGVAPGASPSDVKAAWRRLVSRWHPDRNTSADAAALMQRINGAYERILLASAGDDDDGDDAGTAAGAPAAPPRHQAAGRTVRRRVRLTLEEAALGCTRVLRGKLAQACVRCDGQGALAAAATCAHCRGAGRTHSGLWFGWLSTPSPCGHCDGRGETQPPCPDCTGTGRQAKRYRRSVRFPAGVRDGDVLCADARGRGAGGFDGTLELQVQVAAHRFFVIDDGQADGLLRCELPVDGFAWIAEAWTEVPTLGGLHQMRLRRGRLVYRLRGQGLPLERGGQRRGDCVVTVQPVFPETLGPRQQALLEQLAASTDAPHEAEPLRAWRRTLQDWQRDRHAGADEA